MICCIHALILAISDSREGSDGNLYIRYGYSGTPLALTLPPSIQKGYLIRILL